jgi:hypothetical protein
MERERIRGDRWSDYRGRDWARGSHRAATESSMAAAECVSVLLWGSLATEKVRDWPSAEERAVGLTWAASLPCLSWVSMPHDRPTTFTFRLFFSYFFLEPRTLTFFAIVLKYWIKKNPQEPAEADFVHCPLTCWSVLGTLHYTLGLHCRNNLSILVYS